MKIAHVSVHILLHQTFCPRKINLQDLKVAISEIPDTETYLVETNKNRLIVKYFHFFTWKLYQKNPLFFSRSKIEMNF